MLKPAPTLLTIASAALLAASAAQAASTGISGSCALAQNGNTVLRTCDDLAAINAGGAGWTDPRPFTDNAASWSGAATYGLIGSAATARASSSAPPAATPLDVQVVANSSVGAQDEITFSAPGLNGQAGIFNASMLIDGSLIGTTSDATYGPTYSQWRFSFQVYRLDATGRAVESVAQQGFGDVMRVHFQGTSVVGSTGQPTVNQLVSLSAPIVFGTDYLLGLSLATTASVSARPRGSPGDPDYFLPVVGNASASFGSTATWQGIQSVTLADGSPVLGWHVSSSSGTDYALAVPVPEPGSSAMLLAGLAVLAAGLQRRRARRD